MTRKLIAVVFALLAFNIIFFPFQKKFFGSLIFPNLGSVGFFTFILAFQVFQYLSHYNNKNEAKNKSAIALSVTAVILAGFSVFRTSMVDIFVFDFFSLTASMLSLYTLCLEKEKSITSIFEIAFSPIILFFEGFKGFARGLVALKALPKLRFGKFLNGGVVNIFLGIILGIPVVLLITTLLSSADPIFSKILTNAINLKNFPWWFINGGMSRVIYSVFFLMGVLSLIYLIVKRYPGEEKFDYNLHFVNLSERKSAFVFLSIVAMISFVLAAYLIVDFPYLFADVPETELIKYGVNNLSEYVTKGFNELIVVSVIVYLTASVSVFVYKMGGRGAKLLKWFNVFLLSETVVFIFSIFRRVAIYQETHGLTRVRIYGSVFLAGLTIWTVILILRHWQKIKKWFWYELSVFAVLCLTVFFVKPDYIIANKFKPTVNKEIDYVYISRLSPEAVDGWIVGYKDAVEKINKLSKKDRSTWSQEDERLGYYAFLTLNILRNSTKKLALKYGTAEDIFNAKATYGLPKPAPDIKVVNFTEKWAFEKIKIEIGIKNLIDQEEKAYNLLYNGYSSPRSINQNFDRSLRSPLLKNVEIVR